MEIATVYKIFVYNQYFKFKTFVFVSFSPLSPFNSGNICMVVGGRNMGRVGVVQTRERHPGSFDIVNVKDQAGHTFATRCVLACFPLIPPPPKKVRNRPAACCGPGAV